MKSFLRIALAAGMLLGVTSAAFAQSCADPTFFSHPTVNDYFDGLDDTNTTAAFWGTNNGTGASLYNSAVGSGTDNSSKAPSNWFFGFGGGGWYLAGDWNGADCDATLTTRRMVVAVTSGLNEGATTHAGRYVLASTLYGTSYNFGAIDTPTGPIVTATALPVPAINASVNDTANSEYDLTVGWAAVSGSGNTVGAQGTNPTSLVESYLIYKMVRTSVQSAPTTGAVGSWTLVATVPFGTNSTTVSLPYTDFASSAKVYLALGLRFTAASAGTGYTTQYVSANSNQIGPLGPSDSLGAATATYSTSSSKVTVNWATTSELGVTGFNVYWGATQTGSFTKVNSGLVSPTGSGAGANYSYQFAKPATTASTIYVKVEAVKDSGSEWSAPIAVTVGSLTINPSPRPDRFNTRGTGPVSK